MHRRELQFRSCLVYLLLVLLLQEQTQLCDALTNQTDSITTSTTTTTANSSSSGSSSTTTITGMDSQTVILLANSPIFEYCFGSLLIAIVLIRFVMFGFLLRYRKRTNLQLAQPIVLAVLVLAGSISIASCYLLIPSHNWHCRFRQPLLLTPLTLAGNILTGRVWRILILMTPVLQVGRNPRGRRNRGRSSIRDDDASDSFQQMLLMALTILSDPHNTFIRSVLSVLRRSNNSSKQQQANKKAKTPIMIRQKVSLGQLFRLVTILTIPQLALQLCHIFVPSFQETLMVQPVHRFIEHLPKDVTLVEETCQTPMGKWATYIGIVLTLIPFMVNAYLSLHAGGDLPQVFNEAKSVIRSLKVLVLVMIVALPIVFLSDQADAKVYSLSMMIFAMTMPPCWFIVYNKIWHC